MNKLTGVVSSASDALEMLWWAASVFEHELSAKDGDGAKQGFALISFAQASANLFAWVTSERAEAQSSGRRGDIFRELMDQIVWSHELRAIAEAAGVPFRFDYH